MRFILADLLHYSQEIDAGEEIPPREFGDGFRWWLGGRVAQLVDGWYRSLCRVLTFLESKCRKLVFDFRDCERQFTTHFDRWRGCFVFTLFFGLKVN